MATALAAPTISIDVIKYLDSLSSLRAMLNTCTRILWCSLAICSVRFVFAQPIPPVRLNLPGMPSAAVGVNRFGEVAGYYALGSSSTNTANYIWQNGTVTATMQNPPDTLPSPVAINNNGVVLLETFPASVWVNGATTTLPDITGGQFVQDGLVAIGWRVFGINDNQDVVGCVTRYGLPLYLPLEENAVLWPNLGTPRPIANDAALLSLTRCASAINNFGQVAVTVWEGAGPALGYLWQRGTTPRRLGSLGGHYTVTAAINDSGQITGTSYIDSTNTVFNAFLWTNGTMQNLSPPGTNRSEGLAIDEMGRVLIAAYDVGGPVSLWVWKNGAFTALAESGANWDQLQGNHVGSIASVGTGAIVANICTDGTACIWNVP